MTRWGSTILGLLGLASAWACSSDKAAAPATQSIVIKDDVGRTVAVPKTPKRVLSLAPSNTEWVFALGAGDRLVGRTSRCDYPTATSKVPDMGSLFPPDLERLALARPDLVLMIDGLQDVRTHFEDAGVPVLVLQPRTLAQMDDGVSRLAAVLGTSKEAGALLAAQDRTQRPAHKTTVIYLAGASPAYAAGPQTFIADIIRHAGGQVIDLKLQGDWPQVPLERLALARPDLIIASDAKVAAAIKAGGPAWQAMHARIVTPPDPDWFARPGPRVGKGLRWLASVLQ
jgi:iron complex transport system substrate-binding protein